MHRVLSENCVWLMASSDSDLWGNQPVRRVQSWLQAKAGVDELHAQLEMRAQEVAMALQLKADAKELKAACERIEEGASAVIWCQWPGGMYATSPGASTASNPKQLPTFGHEWRCAASPVAQLERSTREVHGSPSDAEKG